ncbi:SphA family protein [Uliginosibacterium sp. H1]|uniref:SphA family protein n=1 Tax=Uliginosibacterium sp. H1 TaxID=3114757 RepID=UPI002E17C7F0|nr:transporter [Uliginosibacterium sp. H1]
MSFWLPGQFGSLAAVPTAPGWSLGTVYYHVSADEGSSHATQRGGRVTAGADAKADLVFVAPAYAFADKVLGGQLALSGIMAVGNSKLDVSATLSGPQGNVIGGGTGESLFGVSDFYGLGSLKWNSGVHNFMAYTMVGAPVGSYDANRLVNIGLNHWSLDGGGGYTYFDRKYEFSAVAGFTYNFENPDTDYQSGVDSHLDWGASYFFRPDTHAGLVGYFYHQLTGDSGSGARLGDYKSRVNAVGPQIGHFFKVGNALWYANVKGYYEAGAQNRPEGWNLWLSMSIPLGAGKP